MDKIYIVEHRTWSRSETIKVFKSKLDAINFAEEKEKSKPFSDGYCEYYVNEYEVY